MVTIQELKKIASSSTQFVKECKANATRTIEMLNALGILESDGWILKQHNLESRTVKVSHRELKNSVFFRNQEEKLFAQEGVVWGGVSDIISYEIKSQHDLAKLIIALGSG